MEGVALLGAFPLVEEEEDEGRWEEEGLDGGLAPPGGGPVVEKVMVGVFHRSAKKKGIIHSINIITIPDTI